MKDKTVLPVSAVIPTKDRAVILQRTLSSLYEQSHVPAELIVIDASAGDETEKVIRELSLSQGTNVNFRKAEKKGAAVQRVEGVAHAGHAHIFFLDDDLIFEPECIARLWKGFSAAEKVGAVNAMVTNQRYTAPGLLSRIMYRLMSGQRKATFAGNLIGPGWNLMPEDRDDLPEYVPCEWLNTTCTMYRREAMPQPIFDEYFTGYSMLEDVALSARIARTWTLLNARTARIFHDSQPGDHKDSVVGMSEMELRNRHYVMTHVLARTSFGYYVKLAIFELFSLASSLRTTSTMKLFPGLFWGKVRAILTKRK